MIQTPSGGKGNVFSLMRGTTTTTTVEHLVLLCSPIFISDYIYSLPVCSETKKAKTAEGLLKAEHTVSAAHDS